MAEDAFEGMVLLLACLTNGVHILKVLMRLAEILFAWITGF